MFLLILLFLPILCSYWSCHSYWSYCSCWSCWSSVPTDPTVPSDPPVPTYPTDPTKILPILCFYHPLFLLFLCSYWSSFPADPTDPVFLQCTLILTISLWRQLGHRTPAMSQFRLMAWIEFEWATWEFQLWSDFISDVELFMCRI